MHSKERLQKIIITFFIIFPLFFTINYSINKASILAIILRNLSKTEWFFPKIQPFPDMAGEGDSAAIQANSANNQVCSQYLGGGGGGGTEGEDCVGSAATSKLQTGAINGSYGASWAKENTAINLSFMEDDQANLIRRILHAKRTYSFPSSNDIHKVTVSSPPHICTVAF